MKDEPLAVQSAADSKNNSGGEPSASGTQKNGHVAWVKSVVPFSIATGPISTLIVLLILNLHGTVLDVGLAVTLFNAVSIPASIFWGYATDRFHKRKVIIILSYVATAAILILFLLANSIYYVTLLYALFSIVTTAVTTPLNLLVMETSPKPKWSNAFAWFSMLTSIGQTAGLILSTIWSSFFLLIYLVIPLALLSIASAAMSVVMIKEPKVVFERQLIMHNKQSFFGRLQSIPVLFLHLPKMSDFKRFFRTLKYDLTRSVPVLYFSIFMFYVAAGLFNTSLIPSFTVNKVSSLEIFGVVTIVNVIQILSFQYAGPYTEKKSLLDASITSLGLRCVCYGLLGAAFYFVSGVWYLIPGLIFYSIAAGFAYSIYYTASNTMVFNSLGGGSNNGSSLGIYSALVGIATMVGSFVSGFTSFYLSYAITFLLASGCLGFAICLLSLLRGQEQCENRI